MREGRQTEVRAQLLPQNRMSLFSVSFLSQLISLYLLQRIRGHNETGRMTPIVVAKVHQGEQRGLDIGGGVENEGEL